MPTVLTVRNIRVVIYSNDHPPPHVHAVGRGWARAKFELNCPAGPVRLVEQVGFRPADVIEVGQAVAGRLEDICRQWSSIHGRI